MEPTVIAQRPSERALVWVSLPVLGVGAGLVLRPVARWQPDGDRHAMG